MKIKLLADKYKKDIIDICRIFAMDEISFSNDASIIIYEDKIILDREYSFSNKLVLKKILYMYLSKKFNYKSPWGIITGTKPQKLFEKYSLKENIEDLKTDYCISDDKFELLSSIYNFNKNINFNKDNIHLYINIPFCPSRCSYCSFPTIIYKNKDRREEYINFLKKEIDMLSQFINQKRLRSVYIGGGTPSALNSSQIRDLLSFINTKLKLNDLEEFTFEAGREDTLDEDKLKILKEYGVSRISLNPQTFNKNTLKRINRDFDLEHFTKIYDLARNMGFLINMDLILGLSDETLKDLSDTFEYIERFRPDNLTVHTLSIKRGSKISEDNDKKYIGGNIENLVDFSQQMAKKMSYRPYYLYRQKEILGNFENVGYCLNGDYSIYNIVTNEEKESTIGLGMTSNSKIYNGDRLYKYTNFKNLDDYINKLDEEIAEKRKLLEIKFHE